MLRFLITYGALVFAFCLGWLMAALCSAGKVRDLQSRIMELELLREDENREWLSALVRSVAHGKYQNSKGGIT